MNANLPTATDNVYKFACLFGLALIVTGILGGTNVYNASLERQIKLDDSIVELESRPSRSEADSRMLERNNRLRQVTTTNERDAFSALAFIALAGVGLSIAGGWHWAAVIQRRDDKLADMQLEKVKNEVLKLRLEVTLASEAYLERQRGKQAEVGSRLPGQERRGPHDLPPADSPQPIEARGEECAQPA